MQQNHVKRKILVEVQGGNFVCLQLEVYGDRVSFTVPQNKGEAGHAEAVQTVNALSAEFKDAKCFHDAMQCSLPQGDLVDRISFRLKGI